MSQSVIRLLFSLEALWAIAFGALALTAGIRGVRVPGRAFNRVLRPGRAGRERIEAMIDLWSV